MRAARVTLVTLWVAAFGGRAPLNAQRSPSNVLTAEDIVQAKSVITTAYDAVERLRPRWLRPHDLARLPGKSGDPLRVATVQVYLNDFNVGDVDYLKMIPAGTIREMRWLSQNETSARYGPTDGQTAIVVTRKP